MAGVRMLVQYRRVSELVGGGETDGGGERKGEVKGETEGNGGVIAGFLALFGFETLRSFDVEPAGKLDACKFGSDGATLAFNSWSRYFSIPHKPRKINLYPS